MTKKRSLKLGFKKDNRWLQNKTNRLLANFFVRLILKTEIQPNHLTFFSLILIFVFVCFLIQDTFFSRICASVVLFLSLVFDSADGQLARTKNQASRLGDWFDKITDRLKESIVIISISYIVYQQSLKVEMLILGGGLVFLINFMYYNLELLKKLFNFRVVPFPKKNLILQNLLNFGYGERIIYLSLLIVVGELVFALCLIMAGCLVHILVNTYTAIKNKGA